MTTPARRLCTLLSLHAAIACTAEAQITEFPQTVAPGKVLMEIDGIGLSYDRADAAGNKYTAVVVGSTFITAGLTDSVDLQVGAELFLRQSYTLAGVKDRRSGLGDLYFRTKWTFWRNEAMGAALAVIPYVKVPSNTGGVGNDSVEGGFIVPWSMKQGEVTTGAMFQWDHVRNDDDAGYDAHWHVTGYAQRDLTKVIGVYAEATFSAASTGLSHWAGTIGGGITYQITKSLWLDYELQRGLNSRATDWQHVLRVNWEW